MMTDSRQVTIGLPNGLMYHKYGAMWQHFFREIDCDVIVSSSTNRRLLDDSLTYSIDETCLAVKIFLGHIKQLIPRVDYIFIPRFASIYKNEAFCVKFFALADIVRNTFQHARILEFTVDVDNSQHELVGIFRMALQVQRNPLKILKAYLEARRQFKLSEKQKLESQYAIIRQQDPSRIRVLLAAHSYVTCDALMGKQVSRILRELGVEIIYSHIIDESRARNLSHNISSDIYWTANKEILGAVEHYRHVVDGIIFLMSFPCGPDSLAIDLCRNIVTHIPSCVLVMDELQGDAGLKTRLESFVDILGMMKS